MPLCPRQASARVIVLLGAFALCMGVLGLAQPEAQLQRMGFDVQQNAVQSESALLMTIVSLATINTALLYLVGAYETWAGLHILLIVTRLAMGLGLLLLAIFGHGPTAFFAAACWEWIGAALIAIARRWDRPVPAPSGADGI